MISCRFRKAFRHPAEGYCTFWKRAGCYPAGPVWNWEDCHVLRWNFAEFGLQRDGVPGSCAGAHP